MNFLSEKIVKNGKEICASFVITPQTACMYSQKHSRVLYYLRLTTWGSLNKSLVGGGAGGAVAGKKYKRRCKGFLYKTKSPLV